MIKKWWLYHLHFSNATEEFEKIGITKKSVQERFPTEQGTFYKNYEMKILNLKRLDETVCKEEEKRLHKLYKEFHYKPITSFSGSKKECFLPGVISI